MRKLLTNLFALLIFILFIWAMIIIKIDENILATFTTLYVVIYVFHYYNFRRKIL